MAKDRNIRHYHRYNDEVLFINGFETVASIPIKNDTNIVIALAHAERWVQDGTLPIGIGTLTNESR